jgi:hypothetical protein
MADPQPPHQYVPAGPLETLPNGPYQPAAVRRAAFAEVLAGVPLGASDYRLIQWLIDLDDPTCQTITSILWRCRIAGPPAGGKKPAWVPMLGKRVQVKLDDQAVSVGKLLGYSNDGEVQILDDDGTVWHGWPALNIVLADTPEADRA